MRSNPYGGGSSPPSGSIPQHHALASWEQKAIHAVGSVISFWGFKENHGRIWCLLYLRNTPIRSSEIQTLLSLSKGSVSMLLQDLEEWNIVLIHKEKKPKTYLANDKLVSMIVHVFQQREKGLLQKTKTQLEEALEEAIALSAPSACIERLQLMLKLSVLIERLIGFISKLSALSLQTLLEKFSRPS